MTSRAYPSEVVILDQAERIRLVFFGTPAYAVPTLRALAMDPRIDVRLVMTQPDRPAGRGHKLVAPPVKSAALELELPLIQPSTLRDDDVRAQLRAIGADLFVVAAYGLIFSKAILEIPRVGCLNLHASILPRYRGAAPIPAAILNGDAETGITLMMMERGLDTGPIVAIGRTPIEPTDTTESLTSRLAEIGAALALDAIPELVAGRIAPVPQPVGATSVRQLTKADGQIDWRQRAEEIERQVRAMWPWPRAWTTKNGSSLQIHAASIPAEREPLAIPHPTGLRPGLVVVSDGKPIIVCGNETTLVIERGQIAGGKPLAGVDLVRGRALEQGQIFELPIDPRKPLISKTQS